MLDTQPESLRNGSIAMFSNTCRKVDGITPVFSTCFPVLLYLKLRKFSGWNRLLDEIKAGYFLVNRIRHASQLLLQDQWV